MTTTRFTDSAYRRSHGKTPRGQGTWAFQQSDTFEAFDAGRAGGRSELHGEMAFFNGTLTEAKAQARAHFPAGALLALLP